MEIKDYMDEENRRIMETLSENDIAILDQLDNMPDNDNFHTEAYIALICLAGKATCRIGERTFEIGRNDAFLCHPNQFVENAMASIDFKYKMILMSPAYFDSIFMLGGDVWNATLLIKEHPLIRLDEQEVGMFMFDLEMLSQKISAPVTPHRREIISLLMQSTMYEFFDCINPKLQLNNYTYSSAEMLFRKFMEMASESTPRIREVKYYADRLCISPKYLSVVCKQISGNTASTIINNLTTDHIKRLLRTTDKSVKEIAGETNFVNLSTFGKYVRRELGVSPREYRQSIAAQPQPGKGEQTVQH